MNLRNKTITVVSLTIICLVITLILISNFLFINNLSDIEESIAYNDVGIVNNQIMKQLSELNSTSTKLAQSYNLRSAFNDSNAEQIISNSNTELILVVDSNNNISYAKYYNSTNQTFKTIPENVQTYISTNQQLINSTSLNYNPNGILLINNQSLLISSTKITNSNTSSNRTLILGIPLKSNEIKKVLGNPNSSFKLIPLVDNQDLPVYEGIDSNFSQNSPIWINNSNENVQGISILRNKQGEAVFDTEVDEPHSILNKAYTTLYYLITGFIIAGSILGLVILIYLDKMVLFRLKHLSERVRTITKRDDPSKRLIVEGNDEMSDLTVDINQMLESMEKSREIVQKSRLKYKNIFNNTGTAMTIHGGDGKFSMVNSEFEKLSKYSKQEIESKKYWMNFFSKDDLERMKGYSIRRNDPSNCPPRNYGARFIDGNGDVKDVLLTVTTIPSTNDVLTSYMDITRLNNTLNEKELLVREIHHRVKNNLQIISSLINLQSRYITDELSLEVLRESENRIKSISMVHEGLYRSEDLSNINFKKYINNLLTQLIISYGVDQSRIWFEVDVVDVSLPIDTAIPVGLIITEIITNSIKYAFPDGEGNIYLKFSRENGHFTLNIGDNGIGISHNKLNTNKSLGMQLIHSLGDQLDAELKIDMEKGTGYTFKFTEIRYKERM